MNYTFNKTLIEQVKAGTHCIEFNREKDSLEMLQALLDKLTENGGKLFMLYRYIWFNDGVWMSDNIPTNKTPIPLTDFVQPEQSERDVMAELDEKIAKLEKMGAFEMLDFICSPTMSQRLAKLLNGEFKETPNDHAQLVGEPEPKWTPKAGEWFKVEFGGLYYCTISDENGVFGDNQNGDVIGRSYTQFTKPTDKEVEDYMVGLAKEKGFVKGAKVKSFSEIYEFTIISSDFVFTRDSLLAKAIVNNSTASDWCIWHKGKWAEIVNPVRWRAEKGKKYWFVNSILSPIQDVEMELHSDELRYKLGNYFQTKEQAEEMAVLMQFTLNNPDKVKKLMNDGE